METPPAPAKDPVGDGESEACHSLLQASGDESTLNQTGFLLARLKELREWQKLQEDRLIREQEEQMEKLKRQQQDGGNGDESDDATIDQEFSSLASYEEPVPSGSGRVSLTSSEDLDDVGDARDFPPRFSNNDAVPSWAAASEDDDVPRTVFERASAAANEYDDDFDPDDDYDGENNGLADREDEQVLKYGYAYIRTRESCHTNLLRRSRFEGVKRPSKNFWLSAWRRKRLRRNIRL